MLTIRQRQIIDYINESVETKGFPPTIREIGEAVGLKSTATVSGHLNRLEVKGVIKRDPSKPRAIQVVKGRS